MRTRYEKNVRSSIHEIIYVPSHNKFCDILIALPYIKVYMFYVTFYYAINS